MEGNISVTILSTFKSYAKRGLDCVLQHFITTTKQKLLMLPEFTVIYRILLPNNKTNKESSYFLLYSHMDKT
jgi:hypothetical protein